MRFYSPDTWWLGTSLPKSVKSNVSVCRCSTAEGCVSADDRKGKTDIRSVASLGSFRPENAVSSFNPQSYEWECADSDSLDTNSAHPPLLFLSVEVTLEPLCSAAWPAWVWLSPLPPPSLLSLLTSLVPKTDIVLFINMKISTSPPLTTPTLVLHVCLLISCRPNKTFALSKCACVRQALAKVGQFNRRNDKSWWFELHRIENV